MVRNLFEKGVMTRGRADRIAGLMQSAFEASEVADHAVAQLEPAMANDLKDCHVLAAAVAAHAEAIITANLKRLPACQLLSIWRGGDPSR